jgi:hypothetical protein
VEFKVMATRWSMENERENRDQRCQGNEREVAAMVHGNIVRATIDQSWRALF